MAPHRSTLVVPAVGFVLVLAVAFALTGGAASAPHARLHRRVTDYLAALYEGDGPGAARFRVDRDPRVEADRARGLEGVAWRLARQWVAAGEAEAGVHVLWLSPQNQVVHQEVETWRRQRDGTWALWAFDAGPPGTRR